MPFENPYTGPGQYDMIFRDAVKGERLQIRASFESFSPAEPVLAAETDEFVQRVIDTLVSNGLILTMASRSASTSYEITPTPGPEPEVPPLEPSEPPVDPEPTPPPPGT